jgi:hexosaminidase
MVHQVVAEPANRFENTLLPQPTTVKSQSAGDLRIAPEMHVSINQASSLELAEKARRLVSSLRNDTGIWLKAPLQPEDGSPAVKLIVSDCTITTPSLGMDESYQIDVDGAGAQIRAKTLFGMDRGIATFLQLVQQDGSGFYFPALHLEDAPRFPWRGLLLDPGRHFLPVDVVLRTIDAMAAVKLNVLHFHLTENQGFRIESKKYPLLTKLGSDGEFYTQDQVREIVAYAARRGIRVVPEFDMPGHSTSWFAGYPELGSVPGPYKADRTFGIHDEAMDPTKESTYAFLDAFFSEMATLFPDRYVHIGGDESNGKQWQMNPAIAAFMKEHHFADTKALQAHFNDRVQEILRRHGKIMVGWDEIIDPNLPRDVVVQNWHGLDYLAEGVKQGHQVIYSKPYYLDHNFTAEQIYAADPVPAGAGLAEDESRLILGGEACMWGEQVVPATIESRIWPRAAVVAERLWSPSNARDVDDLYRRLRVESRRLDNLGQSISGPQRLLRQLSGQDSSAVLNTLAAAVQPDDFSTRSRTQKNTVDTPMTGFVDAVTFDPPLRYNLERLMKRYLDASDESSRIEPRQQLQSLFAAWETAGNELVSFCANSPRLHVVQARAQQLAALGHFGTSALTHDQSHTKLSDSESAEIDRVMKTAGALDESMVEFAVLPPMNDLFARVH